MKFRYLSGKGYTFFKGSEVTSTHCPPLTPPPPRLKAGPWHDLGDHWWYHVMWRDVALGPLCWVVDLFLFYCWLLNTKLAHKLGEEVCGLCRWEPSSIMLSVSKWLSKEQPAQLPPLGSQNGQQRMFRGCLNVSGHSRDFKFWDPPAPPTTLPHQHERCTNTTSPAQCLVSLWVPKWPKIAHFANCEAL